MKMSTKLKITKLGKAEKALVGMKVPKQKNGNIGRITEQVLKNNGYPFNNYAGADIPSIETEVKSKGIESNSAYKIGSMTLDDILKYPYDDSPLKEKLQNMFIVEHSQTFMKITNAQVYNYSKESIQEILRYAYDSARDIFIQGKYNNYVRGQDSWGYFEHQNSNSWQFRIPVANMKKLMGMSKSTAEKHFDFS